jgi:hypothetical protein
LENLGADGKKTIKVNPEEIGLECMNWIQLVQDGGQWGSFDSRWGPMVRSCEYGNEFFVS